MILIREQHDQEKDYEHDDVIKIKLSLESKEQFDTRVGNYSVKSTLFSN